MFTAWQLVAGGLFLAPLAYLLEGPPPPGMSLANGAGFLYLGLFGTALAYALWFRGIGRLPASSVSFPGLLSPMVAAALERRWLGATGGRRSARRRGAPRPSRWPASPGLSSSPAMLEGSRGVPGGSSRLLLASG